MTAVSGPGLLLAFVAIAAVFSASGLAKWRDRRTAAAGFRALGLPEWTIRLPGPEAIATLELALALALVLATGGLLVAAAWTALGLCAAYWVLIARAARRPEPVSCGCFGSLVDSNVTGWTVARNTALLALAAIVVYAAHLGAALRPSLAGADAGDWTWALTAALVVALAVSMTARPTPPPRPSAPGPTGTDGELDYRRAPIPYGILRDPDGQPTGLRAFADAGARLLFFLSTHCAACDRICAQLPTWRAQLEPLVTLYAVHPIGADQPADAAYGCAPAWRDPDGLTAAAFGIERLPAAVLLGTDGLLAGGPVGGIDAISEFVDEIRAQLAGDAP